MSSVKRTVSSTRRAPLRVPGAKKRDRHSHILLKNNMKKTAAQKARIKRKTSSSFWSGRRVVLLLIVLMFCSLIGAAYWFVSSGKLRRAQDSFAHFLVTSLKDHGFAVEHVVVDGRTRTLKTNLLTALNVQKGDFIYNIDWQQKLDSIEALPWVQSARIERRLPNTLYVKLVERHPIGFWQKNHKHFLVDTEGQIVGSFPLKAFPGFVVATGEGAPKVLPELIQSLGQYDSVYEKVTGAVFVGQRRWDLIINNALTVKLPETNLDQALQRVAELEREHRLISSKVDTIDLRNPGKVYFYLSKGRKEKRGNINKKIT